MTEKTVASPNPGRKASWKLRVRPPGQITTHPLQSPYMRGGNLIRLAALVLVAGTAVVGSAPAVAEGSPPVTTISLQAATAYTPHAPHGGTDDYHCTLVNPHVKENSFIVSSHFYPNSVEVHHAILFLVPPALAAEAQATDQGGKGWTCFGETALPGANLAHIGETPWLSAWAPGHGKDVLPAGVGQPLPKGSLVVMQIHYNLLVGDKPVRAKLVLNTVPASTPLRPLSLALMPAPPDIPCPSGVTGPLCDRTASLADLGQRFGQDAVGFVNTIESVCGRNPAESSCRQHDVVHLASESSGDDRAGGSPHAPARAEHADHPQPGDPDRADHPGRPELQLPLPEGV